MTVLSDELKPAYVDGADMDRAAHYGCLAPFQTDDDIRIWFFEVR